MISKLKDHDRLTLREVSPNDATVVAAIYNETIENEYGTMDLEPKTSAGIARQIEGFGKRETIIVLERDNVVIGWGIIKRYSPRIGYRFCAETSVFLRHSEIRKGYGSFIKSALIERCREYGYHHLIARIWASNEASIEYNRRFGYEMVGIQKEIGYARGEWQDVAVMQLVLEDVPPIIPEAFR